MKRILSVCLAAFLLFMVVGCSNGQKIEPEESSIYNFMNYRCDEIYDIQRLNLGGDLAQKCVSYKFTYDSDGYDVKAYISIPNECIENEKPYKCIIYNRGGNSKIGLLNDEDTANICTATNRIVVASQYRGTDGGTGIDQFGGEDLNDIIALIDMCENDFDFIDMGDLCVAGVSRGGMMAYMTARQDNRVKRIIAISAVSDLVESYNNRDDMKKVLNNYIGGSPEDLPYDYEKRSAICWADEINVPVLMIHSKYDNQVSFVQAEELNDKFKENGTECTFITYDDDVHGLHSKDEKVIFEWLNKY